MSYDVENWATVTLGGILNETKAGDMGVDGLIHAVSSGARPRRKQKGELALKDIFDGATFSRKLA